MNEFPISFLARNPKPSKIHYFVPQEMDDSFLLTASGPGLCMGMTMLIASLPFLPLLARLPPTITKTSSIDAGSSYSSPTLLCSCHNVCCTSPPPNICSSLSCYTCFASVLLCYVCFMFQSKHDCTYVAVAPSLKTRLANTLVRLLGVRPQVFPTRPLWRHPAPTKHETQLANEHSPIPRCSPKCLRRAATHCCGAIPSQVLRI